MLPSEFVVVSTTPRAKPLSLEQRRDQIITVTIDLLLEHGRDVTSREIAEAAGIAEGTVFRAFGDKETLIDAAVERFLDPLTLRTALRRIPHDLDLERTLVRIVELMLERFRNVIRMVVATGRQGAPTKGEEANRETVRIVAELLAEHAHELAIPPDRVADYVRLVALSNAIPGWAEGKRFTAQELTGLILRGVVDHTERTA